MVLGPRTAQLVETQKASAKLTTKEWEQFFHHCVKEALETVNYPRDIYNMDELPFQVQYLSNTVQRMYTRRGRNQVWLKRGNQRKHVTLIGCVSAAGVPLVPVLLWGNQKVRVEWFGHEKCPIHCRATGNGWSSAEVFRERLFDVFLIQAKPNHSVVLFLDVSRTHLDDQTLQEAKAKGIKILCFPPHCSDMIQPLDRGVFKPLKTAFVKLQKACIREGKSAMHLGSSLITSPLHG